MLLAYYLAYVGYKLAGGHEVSHVVHLQTVVTTRNDGFAQTLDGYYVIRVFRSANVAHGAVENGARLAQLDAKHDECSTVNVPTLAHPRHLESVVDINGCKHLRIDDRTYAQSGEKLLQLGFYIF